MFDGEGNFLGQWGVAAAEPTAPYEFDWPSDIAVDPRNGNVYVADGGADRIQEFTADGEFIRTWGSRGIFDVSNWSRNTLGDPGTFDNLTGIAVGPDGYVYTTEHDYAAQARAYGVTDRVQKFTSEGEFVSIWGGNDADGGSPYSDRLLERPVAIAVDPSDRVFVGDRGAYRVHRFDADGNLEDTWGEWGPAPGHIFTTLGGLAVDSRGNVYEGELPQGGARLQKFSADGVYLGQIGTDSQLRTPPAGTTVGVDGVAVDARGNVYLADRDPSRSIGRLEKFVPEEPLPVAGDEPVGDAEEPGDAGEGTPTATGSGDDAGATAVAVPDAASTAAPSAALRSRAHHPRRHRAKRRHQRARHHGKRHGAKHRAATKRAGHTAAHTAAHRNGK